MIECASKQLSSQVGVSRMNVVLAFVLIRCAAASMSHISALNSVLSSQHLQVYQPLPVRSRGLNGRTMRYRQDGSSWITVDVFRRYCRRRTIRSMMARTDSWFFFTLTSLVSARLLTYIFLLIFFKFVHRVLKQFPGRFVNG